MPLTAPVRTRRGARRADLDLSRVRPGVEGITACLLGEVRAGEPERRRPERRRRPQAVGRQRATRLHLTEPASADVRLSGVGSTQVRYCSGRSVGNRTTSRMLVTPARIITSRSMPRPIPPWVAARTRARAGSPRRRCPPRDRRPRACTRFVLESLSLIDRVVELAVRVRELAAVDDDLEAFHERGIVAVARERRGLTGMVHHERGADDLRLDEHVVHLVGQPAGAPTLLVVQPESVEYRRAFSPASTVGSRRPTCSRIRSTIPMRGHDSARSTASPRICTVVLPSSTARAAATKATR